ncbi:Two-component response regulator, FixJ family, consists of REC and HTH domains [Ralstonia sp. 25mfcol4.1]|uniref:response regulator transcription factor n=1 Tax=Burkholderiaceae TaxID=119060 RepID=UPI0004020C01|nr:response regulator [Ralstonia sp. 25mfcol4.1]SDP50392.1 Two-component response regulator, FixJ family, consists of REC and HTH domains [Ralstonia sp. 25mfcol4.1]
MSTIDLGPQSDALDCVEGTVHVVDDDELVRGALVGLLESIDLRVRTFSSVEEFLRAPEAEGPACLVLDVRLRGQSGLAFQKSVVDKGLPHMPIIFMSGHGDIRMTVAAMKAGAVDFLAKPFRDQEMIDAVIAALDRDMKRLETEQSLRGLRANWETLTEREREVLRHLVTGLMNKQIAAAMGVAEITAKIYRGHAMRKMNARSVAEVVRMMQALAGQGVT